MKKIFFFAGPSGSGKTTHGERFAKENNLPIVEASVELKSFIIQYSGSSDVFLREKAKEIADKMAQGKSNDPQTVWLTIKERIESSFPTAKAIIVFGFPRLFEQLELIDEDYEVGKLIVFQLSAEVRRERMLNQPDREDNSETAISNRLKATDLTPESLPERYKTVVSFVSSAGSIKETWALVEAALAGN